MQFPTEYFSPCSGTDVEAWRLPGGRGRTLLGDVACAGNETSVSQCMHRGWGRTTCTHSTDLAVNCGIPPASGKIICIDITSFK